jgi:hypothetical protein
LSGDFLQFRAQTLPAEDQLSTPQNANRSKGKEKISKEEAGNNHVWQAVNVNLLVN